MKKLVEVTLKQGVSKVCRRKLPQISKRFSNKNKLLPMVVTLVI